MTDYKDKQLVCCAIHIHTNLQRIIIIASQIQYLYIPTYFPLAKSKEFTRLIYTQNNPNNHKTTKMNNRSQNSKQTSFNENFFLFSRSKQRNSVFLISCSIFKIVSKISSDR